VNTRRSTPALSHIERRFRRNRGLRQALFRSSGWTKVGEKVLELLTCPRFKLTHPLFADTHFATERFQCSGLVGDHPCKYDPFFAIAQLFHRLGQRVFDPSDGVVPLDGLFGTWTRRTHAVDGTPSLRIRQIERYIALTQEWPEHL